MRDIPNNILIDILSDAKKYLQEEIDAFISTCSDSNHIFFSPYATPAGRAARLKDLERQLIHEYIAKQTPKRGGKYLVTFTIDPKIHPNPAQVFSLFSQAVQKRLSTAKLCTDALLVFEHTDSNLHAHAILNSVINVQQATFSALSKNFGRIDIKKVTNDNGLLEYISKENEPIEINNVAIK